MTATSVRLGALRWNQYTTWRDLLGAGKRADRLGYDALWTWDQLLEHRSRFRRPNGT